jgi:asparagine synthase (glutamine-hydrolysing)
VGIDRDPIDLAFAADVAAHLGSDHHEVTFTQQQVFEGLSELIYHLETWDITTIRASVGMYLVCKYIHEHTDIKVLLTGEISDELFGYKYTDFAPSAEAFQEEAAKRIREIYMYDVLRADRCISAHALEARVPFGDLDFVNYVMSLDPAVKMNRYGIGKYLLRQAFAEGGYLPEHILQRQKAAFSDAVGHSMVDNLKAYAETRYSQADLAEAATRFKHCPPFTKEALLYRELFHQHYPDAEHLIADYWMPNRTWANCDVADPSARALPNYGASGSVTRAGQETPVSVG